MGDMMDCINRKDPRHEEENLAPWLQHKNNVLTIQQKRLINVLQPIGETCLAYVIGNHELAVSKHCNMDMYETIIDGIKPSDTDVLDIRMGISGFLLLKFRRNGGGRKGGTHTMRFYMHHGYGGGDLMGGKALKLERLAGRYDADIHLMGHTHTLMVFPTVLTRADRAGRIVMDKRYQCQTGSLLQNALEDTTTYSELGGKAALPLGVIEIKIKPGAENPAERVRVIL